MFSVEVQYMFLSSSLHSALSAHNFSKFPLKKKKVGFPSSSKEKQEKGWRIKSNVYAVKWRHMWSALPTLTWLAARQFKSRNCRGTSAWVQSCDRMWCLSTCSHFSCTAYSCSIPLERLSRVVTCNSRGLDSVTQKVLWSEAPLIPSRHSP